MNLNLMRHMLESRQVTLLHEVVQAHVHACLARSSIAIMYTLLSRSGNSAMRPRSLRPQYRQALGGALLIFFPRIFYPTFVSGEFDCYSSIHF